MIQLVNESKNKSHASIELDGKSIALTEDIPSIELIDDSKEHQVHVKI